MDAGIKIETLHRLSGQHPAFAYFAGLPGHLGMPFRQLTYWLATDAASAEFCELQNQCGVACVIIGCTHAAGGIEQFGPYAAVARALNATTSNTHTTIAPNGATLALTMPQKTWARLPDTDKAAIVLAAKRMACAAPDPGAEPPATEISISVDRIAQAVIADVATYDHLTRQINAGYFAFKDGPAGLRLKNVV